jgi:hypothetical protein
LDCYNSILTAFSLTADEEGLISQKHPTGTLVPLKVEGRRLVLPTKDWQRKGYGEDYLPFHPGCEVMSREGTSPVIQMLQRQAKAMLAHVIVAMANGLLNVAVDKDIHKDLPLECSDFLKKLSNADKTTKDLLDKLIGAAVKKNRLLTVYLKNGGTYEGNKVNRSAIIRFPILEDLLADPKDTNVLGVTVPKKQRPTLIALFQLLVPNGEKPEEYSFGTTTRVAPYLVSLLNAYHKTSSVLNVLIEQYAEKLHIPVKPIDLYDMSLIETIGKHYNDIPPYSGNEGATNEQPAEAHETVTVAKKAAAKLTTPKETVQQVSRNAAPAPATAPTVTTGKPAASMADFMNATNPQPQQLNLSLPQQQLNTGFVPVSFNQPVNQFAPVSFNQPQVGFAPPGGSFAPAPVGLPSWMGGPPQQAPVPANPFMSATPSGLARSNGSTGLI